MGGITLTRELLVLQIRSIRGGWDPVGFYFFAPHANMELKKMFSGAFRYTSARLNLISLKKSVTIEK